MADAPPDYSVRYAPNQEPSSGYGYNTNPQYGQPTAAPQQTQNVNVVVSQPAVKQVKFVDPRNYPLPRDWNSGLCDCFDDMVDCCCTTWCTSCKLGKVSFIKFCVFSTCKNVFDSLIPQVGRWIRTCFSLDCRLSMRNISPIEAMVSYFKPFF